MVRDQKPFGGFIQGKQFAKPSTKDGKQGDVASQGSLLQQQKKDTEAAANMAGAAEVVVTNNKPSLGGNRNESVHTA